MARTSLRDTDPAWVGRYRLIARLGAGGMGVVYLATAQDGSQVAVKVLLPELVGDAEFRTRFGREVAALIRVRGVCTVRVIAADTTSARPFLVTEYADGPSLSEYVGARGPLDPPMLYGLAAGLAEALTAVPHVPVLGQPEPDRLLVRVGFRVQFGVASGPGGRQLYRHGPDRDRLQRRQHERGDRPHLDVDRHRSERHRHVGHR